MLGLVAPKVWPVSNSISNKYYYCGSMQTDIDMLDPAMLCVGLIHHLHVCKWPAMLLPFVRAFKMYYYL